MASTNAATLQASNPETSLGSDCQKCRMHIVSGIGQEDCLMEAIRSQWAAPFGDTRYCKHPSAQQLINFVNSNPP